MKLEELSKEHKQLFPKAGMIGQYLKYLEEKQEYKDAKTKKQKIKELADMLICIIGIMRFCKPLANHLIKQVLFYAYLDNISTTSIFNELKRKWEVNKSRKWKYFWRIFGGKYKHIGKDGNE